MTRNRFLTGSLASIAVASAITMAAPSAQAADRGCGQPAVDATYTSVVHSPVFRTVPAQTHQEWLWERDVDSYSYEFTRVVAPAGVETDWTREVPGPTEYLFTRTVVDSAAVPAVPGTPEVGHTETVITTPAVVATEWEYQHETTGKTRWEDEDWGAQNGNGNGWKKTGNTRETVLEPAITTEVWVVDSPAIPGTPAVPAITHDESTWATSAPGDDWSGPQDSRPGASSTENQTTAGDAPAGTGWSLVATRIIAAVTDTVWAATAPAGYDPTGASVLDGSHHELTDVVSAAAPDGSGWTEVADSAKTVVDVPAAEELVTDGFVEQVLVSAAQPATDPCVQAPVIDQPASGPQAAPAVQVSSPVSGPVATVLPDTGNGAPPWMAPAGFGAMLAGIAMIRLGRQQTTR